jgi:hypothetical protein
MRVIVARSNSFITAEKGNARRQERTLLIRFVLHCRSGWALLSVVTSFYGKGGTKFQAHDVRWLEHRCSLSYASYAFQSPALLSRQGAQSEFEEHCDRTEAAQRISLIFMS